jgi:hypothetical protein
MPLTIYKMFTNALFKVSAFSDPVRRLQRMSGDTTTSTSTSTTSSRNGFNVVGIFVVGFVIIVMVAIGIFRIYRSSRVSSTGREDVTGAPELPDDKSVHRAPKLTIAKRKQAILELFETSQVTMVSNAEDNTF